MARFGEYPQAITPIYITSKPNDAILLYEGNIELHQNEQIFTGAGKISIRWYPSVATIFKFSSSEENFWSLEITSETLLKIPDLDAEVPVIVTNIIQGRQNTASGIFTKSIELVKKPDMQYLIFHLTGFPSFFGKLVTDTGNNLRSDRLVQEAAEWRLSIDALPDLKDTLKTLKDEGGYAITHVGKLERIDGASFGLDDAKNMLEKLYWYLSFLRGLYCHPLLVVGFDKAGNRSWEYWNASSLMSPWRDILSWFPLNDPKLDSLFENFLSSVEDENWYEVIRMVINWYIESQTSTFVQQGIIFVQLGLEALAWTQFADSYISRDGFEKLPLGDRLRLLLTHSGIPIDIPEKLTELKKVAKEYNWNGPSAIAELRNKIVHPSLNKKDKDKLNNLGLVGKHQIQELGKWYLELALLRFFNYSGEYHNRLDREAFDLAQSLVPWAETGAEVETT